MMEHSDLHEHISGLAADVEDYRTAIFKALDALVEPFGVRVLIVCPTCKETRHDVGDTCPNCGEIDQ